MERDCLQAAANNAAAACKYLVEQNQMMERLRHEHLTAQDKLAYTETELLIRRFISRFDEMEREIEKLSVEIRNTPESPSWKRKQAAMMGYQGQNKTNGAKSED